MYEANPKTKQWREEMVWGMRFARNNNPDRFPIDKPIHVNTVFIMPRPKRPKHKLPAVKPDIDKLQRNVNDALTQSGIITDDSRITTMTTRKRYPTKNEQPGVEITIALDEAA